MADGLSREERERYVAQNLRDDRGIAEGLTVGRFLSKAADATILSYPKSGKTWLSYMVTAYIAEFLGCTPAAARHVVKKGFLRTLNPEMQELYVSEVARRRTPERWAPLVRFGHLDSLGRPFYGIKEPEPPKTERTVLLLRDPRDILVSHFHHVMVKNGGRLNTPAKKLQLPPDYEISEFIRSDLVGIRHVLAYVERWSRWAAETGAPIAYYEDFLRSPKSALSDILRAIGVSEIDRGLVNRTIRNTSFERMRDAEAQSHKRSGIEETDPSRQRMRRGKAGGYVDEVSAEDAAFMTRVMTSADLSALRRYLVPRADRRADSPA